jgi:hypothetical protein
MSSNDDDLFSSESSSKESPKSSDEIFKDIEKMLKDKPSDFFNEVEITSRIVNSFNDSANRYIFATDSYNRSIFDELNSITSGKFSYRVYADILEESLARRFIVFDFLKILASAKDERLLKFFTQKMKLNIDSRFVNTYVTSLIEMLNFAIDYNIEIYIKVCQKIDRTPLQPIIDRDIDNVDLNLLDSDQYINKYFSVIRTEIGFDF